MLPPCRDTKNWFSSSNNGRKYYVRSSFDQIHNKPNICTYILLYARARWNNSRKKNIELPTTRWRTSQKYTFLFFSLFIYTLYIQYICSCPYILKDIFARHWENGKIREWNSNARKFRFVHAEQCGAASVPTDIIHIYVTYYVFESEEPLDRKAKRRP